MLTQAQRNEISTDFAEKARDLFNEIDSELDLYRLYTQIQGSIGLKAIERILRVREGTRCSGCLVFMERGQWSDDIPARPLYTCPACGAHQLVPEAELKAEQEQE